MRTFDSTLVQVAVGNYSENITGLNLQTWLANDSNVALSNVDGDVAMFERQWKLPNVVIGHYFFHSRGKQARKVAKEFLEEIFTGPYDVEVITGLTPIEHKGALWMNKQLNFKEYGEVLHESGLHKFFMLTKTDYLRGINNG